MVGGLRVLRTFFGLAVVLVALPASSPQTLTSEHPCEGDCAQPLPACQSAWQPFVSAVFLGRATEIRKEDVPVTVDGKQALTYMEIVTFAVDEGFIGVSQKVVTVTSGGDLCGFPFSKGGRYLVYGRELPSGAVYVSICSATKWEKEAAEDLKYLRGLPNAPHGATIYGTAFRYTRPENPLEMVRAGAPDTGQKIEVRGTDHNYEAVVDSHGKFAFSGLPPGRYTVVLNADGEVHNESPASSTTVNVADKGCAQFNFWVDPFAKRESAPGSDGGNSPAEEPNNKNRPK